MFSEIDFQELRRGFKRIKDAENIMEVVQKMWLMGFCMIPNMTRDKNINESQ